MRSRSDMIPCSRFTAPRMEIASTPYIFILCKQREGALLLIKLLETRFTMEVSESRLE
jgi:hypothetical protein